MIVLRSVADSWIPLATRVPPEAIERAMVGATWSVAVSYFRLNDPILRQGPTRQLGQLSHICPVRTPILSSLA
jgi:hypothetical protein